MAQRPEGGTADRILDAALASFGSRGYEATSLDALAETLGVRKQSILYWFPSKEALLEGGARLLLAGIVVAAALSRRRSFVGFALLFLGTAMGSPLFALPFWVLGGYLIWRVFKYQRVLTAKGGGARGSGARGSGARGAGARGTTSGRTAGSGRVPASPGAAGRAGATAARERVQASRRRGRKEPAPTGPTPSKRYTPPRPTRPRPPAPPS